MNTKAFIKVTPKEGGKAYIMPEGNRAFYLSQGATIETPTVEEIAKAFPEVVEAEKRRAAIAAQAQAQAKRTDAMTELRNERDALKHDNQKLRDENKALKAEIDALKAIKQINVPVDPDTESNETHESETPVEQPAKKSRGGRRSKK